MPVHKGTIVSYIKQSFALLCLYSDHKNCLFFRGGANVVGDTLGANVGAKVVGDTLDAAIKTDEVFHSAKAGSLFRNTR